MKLFKRIGLGILITLLVLVVLVLGSIIVDGFFAQGRLDPLTNMSVTVTDGTLIPTYLAKPEGDGPFPAVILIHEFWGIRPDLLTKVDALAKEGYIVAAPNVFRSGTTNWLPRAIYNVISADPVQIDSDVDDVYQWLISQPDVQTDRVAIMGFCFGGGTALRYSLSNQQLAATAVFYGQLITEPDELAALPGPVLGIFGGADASIPQEDVAAFEQGLETAGIPHEVTVYAEQPHAFVGGMDEIEAGGAAQEAWNQLLAFLATALKEDANRAQSNPADDTLTVSSAGFDLRYLFYLAMGHLGHM